MERKRKQVIELWNVGQKIPAIVQKTKLSPNTVRNILREEGLLEYSPRPYLTKKVRVSMESSPTQVNQYEPQQSPQQGEEIKVLLQKIRQLTTDLEYAKVQLQDLTKEKETWHQ